MAGGEATSAEGIRRNLVKGCLYRVQQLPSHTPFSLVLFLCVGGFLP